MPLIVDCYNVLRATMPPMLAGLSEAGLCHALARTTWAAGPITVVADGRPKPLGVAESPVAAVDLVYAGLAPGGHRSADDLIIELIRQHSAPRRLTVVSSDREIRKAARARRARDLPSDAFIDKLCHQLRKHAQGPPPRDRPAVGPLPPELVEQWKDYFGITPDAAPVPSTPHHSPAPQPVQSIATRFAGPADTKGVAQLDRHLPASAIHDAIEDQQVLVAVENSRILGVLRFELLWRTTPFLSLIIIDEAHRGRGLSRLLLDQLIAHLRRNAYTSLLSSSEQGEIEPQRWHQHMGFLANGQIDQLPGQSTPELIFRLAL